MNVKKFKMQGSYLSENLCCTPSHCLLNKGITGCGGTTLELRSNRNSIILCPTRNLVTSKSNSDYFGVDGDVTKTDIRNYLETRHTYKKFIATYDALSKLMETIPDYADYFLLIDEYHLLFNDYSFRGDAIQFILKNFTKFKDWCFMTATPLKDEFILEELKDVPKIEYEWEQAVPVNIHLKDTYYVQKTLLEYIDTFKDRNLHIFLNSISTIYNLTKNIDNSIFRVVCSENSKTKIKNFQKINTPVKKLNFYTSCAFEGCDIYDPDGLCIIVCDTNISTTILDISTKIRQVCGRLRDSKYKDQCYLILNTSKHRYAGTTKHEFEQQIQESETLGKLKHSKLQNITPEEEKMELRLYNKETYSTLYLNKYHNKIYYDVNLKKMDIYNYNLISEIYDNTISVMNECSQQSFTPIIETSVQYECPSWILENLSKSRYTYQELEIIFTPLFKEHGLKWNKRTSIKYYFPPFHKKIIQVDKKRETYYIFELCSI